jgi:hypothetical protein
VSRDEDVALPPGALVYSRDGHSVYRVGKDGALRRAPEVVWEDPAGFGGPGEKLPVVPGLVKVSDDAVWP